MASPAADTAFFGHPRGLSTLFLTEMWERFSFYGMRALLILFMTASPASGGLGFDAVQAGAIYGLYTSMVYMATLPGGWLADQILGAQVRDSRVPRQNRRHPKTRRTQMCTPSPLPLLKRRRRSRSGCNAHCSQRCANEGRRSYWRGRKR